MPKRKAPNKKRQARRNWLMSGVSAAASLAFNHPGISGGTLVFGVIFSFVAANALWYQPHHPHPMLDTRSAFKAYVARAAAVADEDSDVTTFKIERSSGEVEGDARTTAARKPARDSKGLKTVTDVIVLDDTLSSDVPVDGSASELVRQIQANLIRRGLYDGEVDGLMGPRTEAAISFYQQTRGMETTGEPGVTLLNALKADNAEFGVVPPDRPLSEVTNAIGRVEEKANDVEALLAQADWRAPIPQKRPDRLPAKQKPVEPVILKADKSKPVAKQAVVKPVDADPTLVKKIQQGLANLAYADIAVDGVAGSQTRTAISHFQKHYRLPVSGLPDELVLEKLKQIGAL